MVNRSSNRNVPKPNDIKSLKEYWSYIRILFSARASL